MATIYISPTGAWNGTGATAATAMSVANLEKAIKLAGPGGTVAFIADKGDYTVSAPLAIYSGGTAAAAVTIKGVSSTGADMTAHFASNRGTVALGAAGSEVFKIMSPNASNLVFENMDFANVASAIRVGADVSNITVKHMTATNVGMFFEDYASGANKTATISGLTLSDITVNGYSKGVVRLQYDTHDVTMSHLVGDSQYQDDADSIPGGVHLEGTVHRVVVSDSVMKNAISADAYYNGDGYSTERGVYDVSFVRAVASGNADGGFDLKSTSTTLIDTIAEGNGRNYRFWGEVTMTNGIGLDPRVMGGTGGQEQVQIAKGANVKIIGGMLSDSGSVTQVLLNEGGVLSVTDTQIVHAEGARLNPGKGMTLLDMSLVRTVKSNGTFSLDSAGLVEALFAPVAPVVTAPPVTTPVVTTPVVTTPVVTTPAVPNTIVHETVAAAPVKAALTLHLLNSTAAAEAFLGTADHDVFVFKAGAIGKDVIADFGKTDMLALAKALADDNKDGLITFGGDSKIDISKTETITIADLKAEGVRALGVGSDGLFYYGDARVRPNKASESTFGGDKMAGDAADKTANTFFYDTALNMNEGADTIAKFGGKDILVTTTRMADVAVGGHWDASGGKFGIVDHVGGVGGLGTVAISNLNGGAITSLEFDGSSTVDGVTYYVYSQTGSAAGLPDLHL